MPVADYKALLRELRTQEARGDGTDVRLVLLEAAALEGHVHQLDELVADLAGGWPGLLRALSDGDRGVMDALEARWEGMDLMAATMRMREVADELNLLVA